MVDAHVAATANTIIFTSVSPLATRPCFKLDKQRSLATEVSLDRRRSRSARGSARSIHIAVMRAQQGHGGNKDRCEPATFALCLFAWGVSPNRPNRVSVFLGS